MSARELSFYRGSVAARMRGLSLIELMVALTISAVLIFGATQVYVDSRNAYNVNETVARLQENARYAMSVMEPDIRMANYWGLLKGAGYVTGQAAQTAGSAGTVAPGAAAQYCGTNFAIDLNTFIQGDNNQYKLSNSRQTNCNTLAGTGWNTSPVLSADTLTVRRASIVANVDGAGKPLTTSNVLEVCSSRTTADLRSSNAQCGAPPDPLVQRVNNLVVNAYYVDNNSAQLAGLPSLHRKALSSAGTIKFVDQEIMAGVEDLQVQFGIEPAPPAGKYLTGIASKYVNPDQVGATDTVVAVRFWLLLRAETPEIGFTDRNIYQYADRLQGNGIVSSLNAAGSATKAYQPSLDASTAITNRGRYRRLLVSKTIQLRNSLGT